MLGKEEEKDVKRTIENERTEVSQWNSCMLCIHVFCDYNVPGLILVRDLCYMTAGFKTADHKLMGDVLLSLLRLRLGLLVTCLCFLTMFPVYLCCEMSNKGKKC